MGVCVCEKRLLCVGIAFCMLYVMRMTNTRINLEERKRANHNERLSTAIALLKRKKPISYTR